MSLHAVDALVFVGSQEDRCELRYNMLYGKGEPEFEIILSTYVDWSHFLTFSLFGACSDAACVLVFSNEIYVLLLHIKLYGICIAHTIAWLGMQMMIFHEDATGIALMKMDLGRRQ